MLLQQNQVKTALSLSGKAIISVTNPVNMLRQSSETSWHLITMIHSLEDKEYEALNLTGYTVVAFSQNFPGVGLIPPLRL